MTLEYHPPNDDWLASHRRTARRLLTDDEVKFLGYLANCPHPSYDEIADAMNCGVGSVKQYALHAKDKLWCRDSYDLYLGVLIISGRISEREYLQRQRAAAAKELDDHVADLLVDRARALMRLAAYET